MCYATSRAKQKPIVWQECCKTGNRCRARKGSRQRNAQTKRESPGDVASSAFLNRSWRSMDYVIGVDAGGGFYRDVADVSTRSVPTRLWELTEMLPSSFY